MTRSKLVVKSLAILVLASGPIAAMAADSGWYVGAALGQSKLDVSAGELKSDLEAAGATGVAVTVDNTDTGWKLYGGYQLNQNIGFEAAYVNLGSATANATYSTLAGSPVQTNTDADGYLLSVVGSLPLGDKFAVFGKLGAFVWSAEASATTSLGPVSLSGDGTDLAFGLGANWKINKSIGLRAEWERFQNLSVDGSNERDVDLLSLGATYRF